MRLDYIKGLVAVAVLLVVVTGVVAIYQFSPGPVLAQGEDPGVGTPVSADRIVSSSTSAHVPVELRLSIGSLPTAIPVGSSVELYLEDDFQVPESIGSSSVYFVATNPMSLETGLGARAYATNAPTISNGPHFGAGKDWSIRVLIPDLCTNPTTSCEGPNGPMQGQNLTMVIDRDAGIRNPSEAGSYGVGYSLLSPVDRGNQGPEVRLDDLPTYAKISLSDYDNRRGYTMTVTGSGFNDGAVAAVYVLHDPSVGSEAFDDGVNETALCERIIRDGFWVGGAFVGSDDRVSVSFEVTVPTFRPGNSNYLCMIDGEGRMSHPDVERFHLEHWIRLNPSNVMPGDTVTIFAQDFPNPGTGFTELKLDGQTATGNVTSTSSIGVDGSGTATLVVPGGLAGTVGVEAAWGNVSATSSLTVIGSAQSPAPTPSSPPPTTNVQVRDGPNPGEVVISWQAVPEATHYRIGYVNMVTDYPLAKASRTGNWLEAFVYVDVEAQNFTVVGGRTEYTIRRLAQGCATRSRCEPAILPMATSPGPVIRGGSSTPLLIGAAPARRRGQQLGCHRSGNRPRKHVSISRGTTTEGYLISSRRAPSGAASTGTSLRQSVAVPFRG